MTEAIIFGVYTLYHLAPITLFSPFLIQQEGYRTIRKQFFYIAKKITTKNDKTWPLVRFYKKEKNKLALTYDLKYADVTR